jgi:amidophosphoribosyltransferase
MKVLLDRIRDLGCAREIHVRVACPPIIAPCFYGIDMSTVEELFAPGFMDGKIITDHAQEQMAKELGCDSLRYLPVSSIARAINLDQEQLCQACITGQYPTENGQRLYGIALKNSGQSEITGRTYEEALSASDLL